LTKDITNDERECLNSSEEWLGGGDWYWPFEDLSFLWRSK